MCKAKLNLEQANILTKSDIGLLYTGTKIKLKQGLNQISTSL